MSMDLRGRDKNCVVKAMASMTDLAIGEESARSNGYVEVDRMDSVAEGLNQAIEPRVQRISARCVASANSLDGGFDLDQGGCREENGILMSLEPMSKARPFWPSRR